MILNTVKGSANIPDGASQISEEEAIKHQRSVINNWPNVWDVMFLRFGNIISAVATSVSAAAAVNVFHPLFKFGTGTFTAVLPSVLLPPAFIYYKTDKVLTNEVMLMKLDCPLCYHLKFLALQLYGGIAFPAILGLLHTREGHNVPYNRTETNEYWRRSFKIAQGSTMTFRYILILQASLAFIVPYMQHFEIEKLTLSIKESTAENSGDLS